MKELYLRVDQEMMEVLKEALMDYQQIGNSEKVDDIMKELNELENSEQEEQ